MAHATYLSHYFATARERYEIRLRRRAGMPREEWTTDPVFKEWRFCNVHREHDKTTVWFREAVRKHLDGLKVVEATIIFRWFNRVETGEIIKDLLLGTWDSETARHRLQHVSPIVTGAYYINTPANFTRLDGILYCIGHAQARIPHIFKNTPNTLRDTWKELCSIPRLGPFMSYEVVSDLRWTSVLAHAEDICTWANAGPGCARGLGWAVYGDPTRFNRGSKKDQIEMVRVMRDILQASRDNEFWPHMFEPWEMREVEHWACEFDKYKRAEAGDNLKRRFAHV